MKTIYCNTIFNVMCRSALDENLNGFVILQKAGIEVKVPVTGFYQDEYERTPLLFIAVDLSEKNRWVLIWKFYAWYENTGQKLSDWVPEFQIVVKMLFADKLVINPKHLELDEVMEEILEIILQKVRQ